LAPKDNRLAQLRKPLRPLNAGLRSMVNGNTNASKSHPRKMNGATQALAFWCIAAATGQYSITKAEAFEERH
jgi:hypothetical protein